MRNPYRSKAAALLKLRRQANPSRPLWQLRAEVCACWPWLHRAAAAGDMAERFTAGTAHGDQEIGLELHAAIQCAAICAPGILAVEKAGEL